MFRSACGACNLKQYTPPERLVDSVNSKLVEKTVSSEERSRPLHPSVTAPGAQLQPGRLRHPDVPGELGGDDVLGERVSAHLNRGARIIRKQLYA